MMTLYNEEYDEEGNNFDKNIIKYIVYASLW